MGEEDSAIIFDNDCKLCNYTIKFLKGRNDNSGMSFFPSASPESKSLLLAHKIPPELTVNTVILLEKKKIYVKSNAVIKALQKKGGIWRYAGIFRIVPLFLRDAIYDWMASNRMKLMFL